MIRYNNTDYYTTLDIIEATNKAKSTIHNNITQYPKEYLPGHRHTAFYTKELFDEIVSAIGIKKPRKKPLPRQDKADYLQSLVRAMKHRYNHF